MYEKALMNEKTKPTTISQGVQYITVDANTDGQRIDNFLRKILADLPKSKIYKILRKGEVRINKKRAKPDTKLQTGDVVRVPPVQRQENNKPDIPNHWLEIIKQSVLYQDNNYLVLNKPAGISVHGGTKQSYGVIDMVRKVFAGENWELAHRLDKETSGCLVFASNRRALNAFQQASLNNQLFKSYLCLVKGSWLVNPLRIESQLGKTLSNGFEKVDKQAEGKLAVSIFSNEESYKNTSLMRVVIETGRTHQIRVQAAEAGYPIAMDDKYGNFAWNKKLKNRGLNRLFLHSHIIRFQGVSEEIYVSAPLPDDLQSFLDVVTEKRV